MILCECALPHQLWIYTFQLGARVKKESSNLEGAASCFWHEDAHLEGAGFGRMKSVTVLKWGEYQFLKVKANMLVCTTSCGKSGVTNYPWRNGSQL